MNPKIEQRIDDLLRQLTVEEKAGLLAGRDDWHTLGIERLGIPSIRVADCGHGVTLVGDDPVEATCFPTGVGMGATWNPELIEEVGRALGRECRKAGVALLLGPMLNLQRLPLGGRNFETFSEDPLLSGKLAAAQVRGIQESGVGACAKAITANNQQAFQTQASAMVDEPVLRELYLRAFEIVLSEANPCAVMTSYNKVNGIDSASSPWLLKDIVKGEWEFDGFIISDWNGTHGPEVIPAGLDLEMPGPGTHVTLEAVQEALESGALSSADLDDKVRRILRAVLRFAPQSPPQRAGEAIDRPEHRELVRQVAEESITLLKNEDDLLPFDAAKIKKITVIGPNAAVARLGGGGSASVRPPYDVSPLEGIRNYLGDRVEVVHMAGCGLSGDYEPIAEALGHVLSDGDQAKGLQMKFYRGVELEGDPVSQGVADEIDFSWGWASPATGVPRAEYSLQLTGSLELSHSGEYEFELEAHQGGVRLYLDNELVAGQWRPEEDGSYEGRYIMQSHTWSRHLEAGQVIQVRLEYRKLGAFGGLRLAWRQPNSISPIDRAVEVARDADAVVLCCGLSNQFEGGNRDRESFDLPGRQNELIERVCAANPRTVVTLLGATPVAMPWLDQTPALLAAWYPGQEGGNALARLLFGEVNPSGRLPCSFPVRWEDVPAMDAYPGDGQTIEHTEGLFVGYRHYVTRGAKPLFPFGYGLSYTKFEYSDLRLSTQKIVAGERLTAQVTITNQGTRAGKETAQLYLEIPSDGSRPTRELRSFKKVFLSAGEETMIVFDLEHRDLAIFDPNESAWRVVAGHYKVRVGPHCLAEGVSESFEVTEISEEVET